MDTVVLKFGGTSVADNEKLKLVANKIISYVKQDNRVIVVVSAQGKETDSLLSQAYSLCTNPCNRELDVLLSVGEQITISKLSILLNSMGHSAVSLTGWQAGIYTNDVNQNAIIEHIDTDRIMKELSNNKIVIVAGFQGINASQDITTLGRGGSDTTAICLSAAIGANSCYIYSDVEGIFTSDPKKIPSANKLKELSYDEMLNISNEGAKVLHNRCVEIGKKFNIPIIAKSTFREDDGTIVNNKIEEQKVKSIVKDDKLIKLQIRAENIDTMDVYSIFVENGIVPIEYRANEYEICTIIKECELPKIEHLMDNAIKEYDVKYKRISRISIIGLGITNSTEILSLTTETLKTEKDNIQNIDINNGKIRITFNSDIDDSLLKKIHDKLIHE